MRVRTLVPVLVFFCALPLVAEDDSDKLAMLLSRAAENAARTESAGTILFSPKDGPQDILAFSWGVSNSGTASDGGGGAGKAQFSDFSFVKRLDKATPILMQACAQGHRGSSGDDDPLDAIMLNFAQMTIDGRVIRDPKL